MSSRDGFGAGGEDEDAVGRVSDGVMGVMG